MDEFISGNNRISNIPGLFFFKENKLKIKFDRLATYRETIEAIVPGTDPVRDILDANYEKFLVVGREMVEQSLGEVEAA